MEREDITIVVDGQFVKLSQVSHALRELWRTERSPENSHLVDAAEHIDAALMLRNRK